MDLLRLMRALAELKGSDLHLKVGRPPILRVAGDLIPAQAPPLEEEELRAALFALMNERLVSLFEKETEVDFSYEMTDLARFRINVHHQRGHIGCVMRLIPLAVPTVESLELPPVLNKIAEHPDGLVLVTGPTGSGKSTTLAAMIQHINVTVPRHIVTVEDPIEYTYTDAVSTITQRELGIDVLSIASALRTIFRQDPDVILMGEMRDLETLSFGITAAETGHLVFATLHTKDAKQSVERILDTVPPAIHKMVRSQLALLLRAILCQRLCRRAEGKGRVAAVEILINSSNVSRLIDEGDTRGIERAIFEGGYYGMQTFNQALYGLVRDHVITEQEALAQSSAPEDLLTLMRGIHRGGVAPAEDRGGLKKLSRHPGEEEAPKDRT
jgi:twitching motility protein PilT